MPHTFSKIALPLSEKSEGRGRNGWFILREALIWHWQRPSDYPSDAPEFDLEFYSSRHGQMAPILLKLNREDLDKLHTLIGERLSETS